MIDFYFFKNNFCSLPPFFVGIGTSTLDLLKKVKGEMKPSRRLNHALNISLNKQNSQEKEKTKVIVKLIVCPQICKTELKTEVSVFPLYFVWLTAKKLTQIILQFSTQI